MDTNTCEYYFRTYDNLQIFKAKLSENHKEIDKPISLGKLTRPMSFNKFAI